VEEVRLCVLDDDCGNPHQASKKRLAGRAPLSSVISKEVSAPSLWKALALELLQAIQNVPYLRIVALEGRDLEFGSLGEDIEPPERSEIRSFWRFPICSGWMCSYVVTVFPDAAHVDPSLVGEGAGLTHMLIFVWEGWPAPDKSGDILDLRSRSSLMQ